MNEENENENKINHDEQNNNETNYEEQNQNNQISNDGNKAETNTESPVNQTSQSAKKSNTGLIVTIIILAIIIIALIGVGIFLFVKENVKDFVEEGVNEVSTIIDQGENIFEQSGMLNTLDNVFANNINNSTTNTIDTNSTTNTGSNGTASASSLENPLQVGEWGIASKYNTETRSDQDVNISVTNIIRGEEAAEMAKEYMSSDYSIYKYEEPEAYLEWVVIEYDVDFADTYIPGELGASPNVEADITGPDGSSIKYNGITYITSTIEIGSRDYIKTKTGSGKILTQIPIGCTDYIIQFGRYGGTTAYFQGK